MIEPKSAFHIQPIVDNEVYIVTSMICDDAVADAIAELDYVLGVQPLPAKFWLVTFDPRYSIEEIREDFPKEVAMIANASRLLGDAE